MTEIATVYATFANAEEAEKIARIVVAERLAACANILGPCRSIYRWQGQVETGGEVAALFKTRSDAADALIARIAAMHSYDVPAIVAWPVKTALPAYAAWVDAEVCGDGFSSPR
jgi:periplasmic divalent cation tolerance protein